MSSQSTVLSWDVIRVIASASVSASYTAVGLPLAFPARLIKIVNNSNEDVLVSINGVDDHDFVPANGFVLYDCGTNRGNTSPELTIRQDTQIFVKGTAGTGAIYVVTLYALTVQTSVTGV